MILKYAKQLPENTRLQILNAVNLICSRYQLGEKLTSIMMPPRFGKSDVIRLSALELMTGTGYPALMTAPWADNVDQIKATDKITEMYQRYGIPSSVKFTSKRRSEKLQSNTWWKPVAGVPTMMTFTLGLIQNKSSQQQFLDGVNDMHQRFNKPIPLFIDEAHLVKETKEWGKFILQVSDLGAYIVLLTGTPVPGVPGFRPETGDWTDIVRTVMRRKKNEDGDIDWFLDTYEGEKRKITKIAADLNVSWREAWDISVPALAGVDPVIIDIEVTDKESNESLGPLSKLPKSELVGRLKSVEEDPEMIAKKSDVAVDRLLQLQAIKATEAAQALVITGTDRAGEGSNVHAQLYREAFRKSLEIRGLNPADYSMEIATGVDNDGNPNAESAKLIKSFREGKIDILFVKSMGIVGMDAPMCKVLVFGSTLRKGPMAIQALSRVLTVWKCRATIIMSHDIAMTELFDRLITDNGGQNEINLTLVESEETLPPDPRAAWGYRGAKVNQYQDELGGRATGDYETELRIIKNKYQLGNLSDRQIIENYLAGAFPVNDVDREADIKMKTAQEASGIRDLDEGLEDLQGVFGKLTKEITNKYVDYGAEPKRWLEKIKDLGTTAKRLCNVLSIKVSKIDDVVVLRQLIDSLPRAEAIVFGNGNDSDKSNRSAA